MSFLPSSACVSWFELVVNRRRLDWNDSLDLHSGVLETLEDALPTTKDISRPRVVRIEPLIPSPSFVFLEEPVSLVTDSFGLALRQIISGEQELFEAADFYWIAA